MQSSLVRADGSGNAVITRMGSALVMRPAVEDLVVVARDFISTSCHGEEGRQCPAVGGWHRREMGGVERFPTRTGTGAGDFHADPVPGDDVGKLEKDFPFLRGGGKKP